MQLNLDTGSVRHLPVLASALPAEAGSQADTWVLSSQLNPSQAGLGQHAIYDSAESTTAREQVGTSWYVSNTIGLWSCLNLCFSNCRSIRYGGPSGHRQTSVGQ